MANNKSIQILRGNASAVANNAELVLLDGQPLYDKDNHNLYVGDGTTTLANLKTVGYVRTNVSLNSIAMGESAASGTGAIAIGSYASANGNYSTALGYYATANDVGAIALGNNAAASSWDSIAIGHNAAASSWDSIAIGYGAIANNNSAAALGNGASASNDSAIAIGESASAHGLRSIAIGESASAGDYSTALGYVASATDTGAIAIGSYASAHGNYSTALGCFATAPSNYSTALGSHAAADGNYSTALGCFAIATGNYSTALGSGATASTDYTIVLGSHSITSLRCQVQTISSLSDSRVKEDVTLANTAQCLVDVNRLPVSRFKYKDFTGTHLDVHRTGFMADNVEKVFPKAVAVADETFPVLDEEGNKVYEQEVDEKGNPVMKEKTFVMKDVKSIAMEMAIPTLWGAVQELTKRVESLEAELSLLKNG